MSLNCENKYNILIWNSVSTDEMLSKKNNLFLSDISFVTTIRRAAFLMNRPIRKARLGLLCLIPWQRSIRLLLLLSFFIHFYVPINVTKRLLSTIIPLCLDEATKKEILLTFLPPNLFFRRHFLFTFFRLLLLLLPNN